MLARICGETLATKSLGWLSGASMLSSMVCVEELAYLPCNLEGSKGGCESRALRTSVWD